MRLDQVNSGIHRRKKLTRVGRGLGSGHGKTSGRGGKGQTARAGYKQLPIFQGGSTPLVRRVPKRGFTNSFALKVMSVNVGALETEFSAGEEVTPDALRIKDLAKGRYDILKILGNGELTKKLVISAHRFSKTAAEKIEKAGGKMVVLPRPTPVAEKQRLQKEATNK